MPVEDILTELTAYAVACYRRRPAQPPAPQESWFANVGVADPVMRSAHRTAYAIPVRDDTFASLVQKVLAMPEMTSLAPQEGVLDPFVSHAGGGVRMSAASIVGSIFSSALLQMYYLRLDFNETVFVRTVLESFEELRRALAGELVRAHVVHGIAGIALSDANQVRTVWGTLRSAPKISELDWLEFGYRPRTASLLVEPRLLRIRFDRTANPSSNSEEVSSAQRDPRILFPLACTLAAKDPANPSTPSITWSAFVLPFQGGSSYSTNVLTPSPRSAMVVDDNIAQIEEWARIVDRAHLPTVDIAARRLISACAHRFDPSDALIDAVMVWETLAGTSSETTFRVTAALVKLIESDRTRRSDLRRELAKVYDVRSRIVHGVAVDQAKVSDAARRAVGVAVTALAMSYQRGSSWLSLSSTDRADQLLLNED